MRVNLLFALLILIGWSTCAQDIPRDTTYTLSGTLAKVQKYHPDANASAVYSHSSKTISIEKEVVYKTIGDRQLSANCFYPNPDEKSKYPGLLLIHGGGWRAGNKSLMTPLAERIAEAGYVVIAPEYRLSLEAPYPAGVKDLLGAVSWMIENSEKLGLDIDRIAVAGCSAGGQLASLIGTTSHKELYQSSLGEFQFDAIIDIDGVLAFKHRESEEGTVAAQWLGGTYEEASENWEEASALNHVDENTPPVLFLASMYPRFLAGREDFIEKLNSYGTYSETKFFEDAPHSFWLLNPWFEPTVDCMVGFLDKVLKR